MNYMMKIKEKNNKIFLGKFDILVFIFLIRHSKIFNINNLQQINIQIFNTWSIYFV